MEGLVLDAVATTCVAEPAFVSTVVPDFEFVDKVHPRVASPLSVLPPLVYDVHAPLPLPGCGSPQLFPNAWSGPPNLSRVVISIGPVPLSRPQIVLSRVSASLAQLGTPSSQSSLFVATVVAAVVVVLSPTFVAAFVLVVVVAFASFFVSAVVIFVVVVAAAAVVVAAAAAAVVVVAMWSLCRISLIYQVKQ